MAIVQHAKNYAALAAGSQTITCAFGSPVTAGNTLVVLFTGDPGNIAGNFVYPPAIADTLLNAYTTIDSAVGHYPLTGLALAAYYFPNTAGGANTITLTVSSSHGCTASVEIFEVSGLGTTPTLQGHGIANSGTSIQTITFTDGNGVSVTSNWNFGPSGYLSCILAFDLRGTSGDFFVAATGANSHASAPGNVPTFTPTTYGTYALLDSESGGSGDAQLYVFTHLSALPNYGPPPTTVPPAYLVAGNFDQGTIGSTQIKYSDKQGIATKLLTFTDTPTLPLGNLVALDANGTACDSGIPLSLVTGAVTGNFLFDDAAALIIDDAGNAITT